MIPRRSIMFGAGAGAALAAMPAVGALAAPATTPTPSGGRAVAWNRVPTAQPVAFITIDDGYNCDQQAAAYVEAMRLPVTMFLSVNAPAVFEQPDYFRRFQSVNRNTIQSHGAPHDDLRGKTYATQYAELSHAAGEIERIYGVRPMAFRPPYGQYDDSTRMAAYDTGTRWLVRWTHAVVNGAVRNECGAAGDEVMCGDIVLCHFDAGPSLYTQLVAAHQAILVAGLRPANLASYLMEYPT